MILLITSCIRQLRLHVVGICRAQSNMTRENYIQPAACSKGKCIRIDILPICAWEGGIKTMDSPGKEIGKRHPSSPTPHGVAWAKQI